MIKTRSSSYENLHSESQPTPKRSSHSSEINVHVEQSALKLIQFISSKWMRDIAITSRDENLQMSWFYLTLQANPIRAIKFIDDIAYRAIDIATKPELLLRADSPDRLLLTRCIKSELQPLTQELIKIIAKFSKFTLYAPSAPESENYSALSRVINLSSRNIETFCKGRISPLLQHIFRTAYQKSNSRFPEHGLKALISLLFLQGINPILTDQITGDTKQSKKENKEHIRIVTIIIQKLANQTLFDESHKLSRFNDTIRDSRDSMQLVIKAMESLAVSRRYDITPKRAQTGTLKSQISQFISALNDQIDLFIDPTKEKEIVENFRNVRHLHASMKSKSHYKLVQSKIMQSRRVIKAQPESLLAIKVNKWTFDEVKVWLKTASIPPTLSDYIQYHEISGKDLLKRYYPFEKQEEMKHLDKRSLGKTKLEFQLLHALKIENREKIIEKLNKLGIKKWKNWHVCLWLYHLMLKDLIPNAIHHEITGATLLESSEKELIEALEVKRVGLQVKLRKGLSQFSIIES